MNKIISISREFGSGGRELGKRLADKLGCAYYDKEIVQEINLKMPNLLSRSPLVDTVDLVAEKFGFESISDLLDYLLEPLAAAGVKLRHRLPVGEGRPLLPAHPSLIGRVVLDLRPGPALKVPEVALPQVGDLHRLQLREQNPGRLPAPEHGGDPQGLHRGHVFPLLPGQGLPLRGQGLVGDSNILLFQIARRDAVAQ